MQYLSGNEESYTANHGDISYTDSGGRLTRKAWYNHPETGVHLLQAVSGRYRGNYRSKPGKHLEMLPGGSFVAAVRSACLAITPLPA